MSDQECISHEKSINTNSSNDSTSTEELCIKNSIKSLSNSETENTKNIPFSNSNIKEVYEDNFIEEIKKITNLIEEDYNYVGMDTEFPGTVFNSKNYTEKNFYYETLKLNINSFIH